MTEISQEPEDLVLVREAAQRAGVTANSVYSWIRDGKIAAEHSYRGQVVSVAAVRALAPDVTHVASPSGPREIPADDEAEYVLPSVAARLSGISAGRVHSWIQRGRVASKPSTGHGRMVRLTDVQALAAQPQAAGEAEE